MLEVLKKRPILIFLLLAYGISYSAYYLRDLIVGPQWFDETLRLVTKFGPSLAGIFVILYFYRLKGLVSLVKSLTRFRVSLIWFMFVLLIPLIIAFSAIGIYALTTEETIYLDPDITAYSALVIYLSLLTRYVFAGGGMGEELGWRGFMLPYVQRYLSPLQASIIIGIVHSFWHTPAYGLMTIPFTLYTVALSIVFTWIFNNTRGSILLMVLLHGSINASTNFMDELFPQTDENMIIVVITLTIWLIIGLVLMKYLDTSKQIIQLGDTLDFKADNQKS